MNYIFISDIHSNFDELEKIKQFPEYQDPQVKFIFCGDYIDGYDQEPMGGIKVIDFIQQLIKEGKAEALLGNHDMFMLGTASGNKTDYQNWKLDGGKDTWDSWGIKDYGFKSVQKQLIEKYKPEMKFLSSLPLVYDTNNFIAVHAGFDWSKSYLEQDIETLLWTRENYFFESPIDKKKPVIHKNETGKVIVSGHTPTFFINNNLECPIVCLQNSEDDKPRYLIDGGSNGNLNGGINYLELDQFGNYIKGGKIKDAI